MCCRRTVSQKRYKWVDIGNIGLTSGQRTLTERNSSILWCVDKNRCACFLLSQVRKPWHDCHTGLWTSVIPLLQGIWWCRGASLAFLLLHSLSSFCSVVSPFWQVNFKKLLKRSYNVQTSSKVLSIDIFKYLIRLFTPTLLLFLQVLFDTGMWCHYKGITKVPLFFCTSTTGYEAKRVVAYGFHWILAVNVSVKRDVIHTCLSLVATKCPRFNPIQFEFYLVDAYNDDDNDSLRWNDDMLLLSNSTTRKTTIYTTSTMQIIN